MCTVESPSSSCITAIEEESGRNLKKFEDSRRGTRTNGDLLQLVPSFVSIQGSPLKWGKPVKTDIICSTAVEEES